MRVLCVGSLYPPHHLGGYELVWQGAVRHLRERGHSVRVLASDHRESGVGEPDEAEVHRELGWYWRDHEFPRMSPLARLRLERANAEVFERQLAELRPQVVSWWAMGGMSLSLLERARGHGLPAVGFVHDEWLRYGPQVDGWLRLTAHRGVPARLAGIPTAIDPGRCGRWLFVSEAIRAAALTRWALPDSGVASSGIAARYLAPAAPAGEWAGRLLHVGRLDERKGIDLAIEALARVPSASLRVVGAGDEDELARLRALAARAGVDGRVRFEGPVAAGRMVEVYDACDAVLFPVRWEEPWGLVPLEAMARERPVLATGTGGSAEYLRDGENCLLFAREDAGALAAAVERLAGDPALRARLAAGGRVTAGEHSEARFHEAVEAALLAAAAGVGG